MATTKIMDGTTALKNLSVTGMATTCTVIDSETSSPTKLFRVAGLVASTKPNATTNNGNYKSVTSKNSSEKLQPFLKIDETAKQRKPDKSKEGAVGTQTSGQGHLKPFVNKNATQASPVLSKRKTVNLKQQKMVDQLQSQFNAVEDNRPDSGIKGKAVQRNDGPPRTINSSERRQALELKNMSGSEIPDQSVDLKQNKSQQIIERNRKLA